MSILIWFELSRSPGYGSRDPWIIWRHQYPLSLSDLRCQWFISYIFVSYLRNTFKHTHKPPAWSGFESHCFHLSMTLGRLSPLIFQAVRQASKPANCKLQMRFFIYIHTRPWFVLFIYRRHWRPLFSLWVNIPAQCAKVFETLLFYTDIQLQNPHWGLRVVNM